MREDEDDDIEIDDSTYSLLDAIVKSNDDPLVLAALAEVDPDDFREFLTECNEVESRDAIQLLKAAEAIKFSNTAPSTISMPALDARNAVSEPGQNLTFIILSKDPGDSKEMVRALSATATASVLMTSDDAEQAFTQTVRLRPSAVIINLARMGMLGLKLVQRITVECASTAVICASRDPSPELMLGSLRAGARNFLQLPIIEKELSSVIKRTAAFVQEHAADEPLEARNAVSEPRQKLTFIVLSKDPGGSKEMVRALSATATASVLMMSDDAEQVFIETVRLRPSAVIINLARMGELGLKLVQRITVECASTAVICASRDSSPDMILRSMKAGARDFLRLPIIQEELIIVIERIAAFVHEHAADEPMKRGRAIAVFSSKGGCGCSLIATNLAMLQPNPTVLVDLNLQSGDLDLLLRLRPKFSLADVVENRERLDESLTSYLTHYSKNVSLLAAPLKAESADDIEPRHIYEIMESLRHRFDSVIIDTPHSFDAVTISALDHADQILVVLTLEIPAIRSTRRALEIFDRLGYPRKKIRLVVNRWSKNIDLDQKQVEDFLGERVVGFIPRDDRVVVNSVNLGQPAVNSAPSSEFAREIIRIAPILSTDDYQKVKNIKASRDLQVHDLLRKANMFDDFLARFRPKEST